MMQFSKYIVFRNKRLVSKQILPKRLLMTKMKQGVYSFEPDLPGQSSDSDDKQERNASDFSAAAADAVIDYYERPTPIIFVSGESLTAKIWFNTSKYFSDRGYSGLLLSLPDAADINNINDGVRYVEKTRAEFGTIPPVMIAHSVSSFIAQKYLESYALKGLVLVNPVPPVPGKVVQPLINLYEKCEEKFNLIPAANNEDKTSLITQCYYNLESQGLESVPFPLNFMNSLMEPKAKLSLEGGRLPLLIVSTDGDSTITVRAPSAKPSQPHEEILDTNFSGDMAVLTVETLQSMCEFHRLDPDSVIVLKSPSRAPMIDPNTSSELNKILFDWIEDRI